MGRRDPIQLLRFSRFGHQWTERCFAQYTNSGFSFVCSCGWQRPGVEVDDEIVRFVMGIEYKPAA